METGAFGLQMEREIAEQPEALQMASARLPRAFEELPLREYEQVVLVARGSSDNAALYLRYLIEVYLGIPAVLAAPSVATVYHGEVRYRKALGVAISQSGQSPDVLAVIGQLNAQGHDTLAITNAPNSPLAGLAKMSIDIGVGPETSIAATKTYTASLVACHQLAIALGATLQEPQLPDENWMLHCRQVAEIAVPNVLNAHVVLALARGFSYASANEAALKLTECALVPCKSYSTADFEHGPKALLGPNVAAIVFGSVPKLLIESGCAVIAASSAGAGPDAPIREIVFAQYLALLTARAKGIDPDLAPHLSKVTRTY